MPPARPLPRWTTPLGVALIVAGGAWFAALLMLQGANRLLPITGATVLAAAGLALVLAPRRRTPRDDRPGGDGIALATVFFTFATLGPILMMVLQSGEVTVGSALVGALISGTISTLWAAAFIFRKLWLLPLVIVYQVFGPWLIFRAAYGLGLLDNFGGLGSQTRMGAAGLISVACLVVGYVLFVRYTRTVERAAARAEAELATAAEIHRQLVPEVALTAHGWQVAGRSIASSTMGGDLIDAVVRDRCIDLVLADVTGHGVRAGVVMAMAKGVLRAELDRLGDDGDSQGLSAAASRMNSTLCRLTDPGTFVTAILVRAWADGRVDAVNAGHPPAAVADGHTTRPTGTLEPSGLPLGVEAGESYPARRLSLAPGSSLVLFSDGLSEAADGAGRQWGIAGVHAAAAEPAADSAGTAASLLAAAAAWSAGRAEDDRTVLVLRREMV